MKSFLKYMVTAIIFIWVYFSIWFILFGCFSLSLFCDPITNYKGLLGGGLGAGFTMISIFIMLGFIVAFVIHGYFKIKSNYKKKNYIPPKLSKKELLNPRLNLLLIVPLVIFIGFFWIFIFSFLNFTQIIEKILLHTMIFISIVLLLYFLEKKYNIEIRGVF